MTKATAYHCDTSCTAVKQLRTRKPNSQFKIESNIKDMSINDGFSEMQSLGEEVVFEDTPDRADAVHTRAGSGRDPNRRAPSGECLRPGT